MLAQFGPDRHRCHGVALEGQVLGALNQRACGLRRGGLGLIQQGAGFVGSAALLGFQRLLTAVVGDAGGK